MDPSAQLKDAFNDVSQKLTSAAKSSGADGTGAFMEKLNGIKDEVGKGHDGVLQQIMQVFSDFQQTLQKALNDPSSLAPGGGCAAAAAGFYTKNVQTKLQAIKDEGGVILQMFQTLAESIRSLLANLQQSLNNAVPTVKAQVKELLDLPKALMDIAYQIESGGMSAITHLDMTRVNRCLDVTPINQPLDNITNLKQGMGGQIDEVQKGVSKLSDFKEKVPNKVKHAFELAPCIPVSSVAPPIMGELLSKLDSLKQLNMKPLLDVLNKVKFHIGKFDAEKVKKPLNDFSNEAKGHTSVLTDSVQKAQQAAGAAEGFKALAHGDAKGAMNAIGGAMHGFGF